MTEIKRPSNIKQNGKKKYLFLTLLFAIAFFGLFIDLIKIQIVDFDIYDKYRLGSVREEPVNAIRGEIFDRNGVLLVRSVLSTKLSIVPHDFIPEDYDKDPELERLYQLRLNFISNLLNLPVEYIKEKIEQPITHSNPYEEKIIKNHLSPEVLTMVEEYHDLLPGVKCSTSQLRKYIYNKDLSHLLGVTGYISLDQLVELSADSYADQDTPHVPPYRSDSIIGKIGVEKEQDYNLRGIDGVNTYLVNIFGERISDSTQIISEPQHGNNIRLTIDYGIQEIACQALGDRLGCVIVSNIKTGEILALASSPSFNPNTYSLEFSGLIEDPGRPLINRATMGNYPPGSVFKLVVASAALETPEFDFDPYASVKCQGGITIGRRGEWFGCNRIHGNMNLFTAIQYSCNTYFYGLGINLGWDNIYSMAKKYGLGEPSGIDFGYESAGLLPTREWKEQTFGMRWYDGNTAHASIGQGYLHVTPLQIHNITCAIANNGTMYRPHIIMEVLDPQTGSVLNYTIPEVIRDHIISPESASFLKDAMRMVVKDGTAYYARFSHRAPVAGKTGSSQNPYGESHAWFTCFAPYIGQMDTLNNPDFALDPDVAEHPPIAITVFIENGGSGGIAAAPIATVIMKYIFEHKTIIESEREMGLTIYVPRVEDNEDFLMQQRLQEELRERAAIQRAEIERIERRSHNQNSNQQSPRNNSETNIESNQTASQQSNTSAQQTQTNQSNQTQNSNTQTTQQNTQTSQQTAQTNQSSRNNQNRTENSNHQNQSQNQNTQQGSNSAAQNNSNSQQNQQENPVNIHQQENTINENTDFVDEISEERRIEEEMERRIREDMRRELMEAQERERARNEQMRLMEEREAGQVPEEIRRLNQEQEERVIEEVENTQRVLEEEQERSENEILRNFIEEETRRLSEDLEQSGGSPR